MGRRPCCEKVGLKKGRWTEEEDDKLKKYIMANGEGSWRQLPKRAGLLRCGKSCRLRWINYLKPDLRRGNISAGEEEMIVKLQASLGNRWSLIARHLVGRTDNEIKNYWNSHLRRKIYEFRKQTGMGNPPSMAAMDLSKISLPPKRRRGRTSRWEMKKNRAQNQKNKASNGDDSGIDAKTVNESVPIVPTKPTDTVEKEMSGGSMEQEGIGDLEGPQITEESFENFLMSSENLWSESMWDNDPMEIDVDQLFSLAEERENDGTIMGVGEEREGGERDMTDTNPMLDSTEEVEMISENSNPVSGGNGGDDIWNSFSPQLISNFDEIGNANYIWEWELENGGKDQQAALWSNEDFEMLSRLWDGDGCETDSRSGDKTKQVDSAQQEAIMAWLLS